MSLSTFENLEDHCDLDWAWLALGVQRWIVKQMVFSFLQNLKGLSFSYIRQLSAN